MAEIEEKLFELLAKKEFAEAELLFRQIEDTGDHFVFNLAITTKGFFNVKGEVKDEGLRSFMTTLLQKMDVSNLCLFLDRVFQESNSHRLTLLSTSAASSRLDEINQNRNGWDKAMHEEWPFAVQKKLCKELEQNTAEVRFCLLEFAAVLDFYNLFPEVRYVRFERLLDDVFKKVTVNSLEMCEFIPHVARILPFHPFMVLLDSENLLPRVLNPLVLAENVCEALTDYISVSYEERVHLNIPAVQASLDLICELPSLPDHFQGKIEALLYALFPFVQDFHLRKTREALYRKAEEVLNKCSPKVKVLILKRLAEKLARPSCELEGSPLLLAWIVNLYKTNMSEEVFREELGSFWCLLENVRYEDIPAAMTYYGTVQNLFQVQILNRIRLPMVRVVKERLMDKLRDQLGDWIQLQSVKNKMSKEEEEEKNFDLDVPCSVEMNECLNNVDFLIYQFEYNNELISRLPKE